MRIHSSLTAVTLAAAALAVVYWHPNSRPHAVSPAPTAARAAKAPPPPAAIQSRRGANIPSPHLLALPLTAAGHPHARNTGMERALEEDEPDPAWTSEVEAQAHARLAGDPALHIDALQCTRSFCRIQMTKPVDSSMDWEAVDQALAPIARGETIFGAERAGAETTGYIYFAALGSNLPIDQVHEAANRRADWSP